MSVPIGISFGDLVALVNITKNAVESLKASGGASENYSRTVKQLESRLAALQTAGQSTALTGNSAHINAIRSQTQSIENSVRALLSHIRNYQEALSNANPSKSFTSIKKKVKWGTYESKQVDGQWKNTTAEMATTSLLFDINICAQLAGIKNSNSELLAMTKRQQQDSQTIYATLKHLSTDLGAVKSMVSENPDSISLLQTTSQDILNLVHDQSSSLQRLTTSVHDLNGLKTTVPFRLAALQSQGGEILSTAEQHEQSLQHLISSTDNIEATALSIERMLSTRMSQLFSTDEQVRIPPDLALKTKPRGTQMLSAGLQQVIAGICGLIFELLEVILRSLTSLVHLLPQVSIYLRIMQVIPKTVSLMLSDNIRFVDVLGTKHSLPFQDFRSWSVFQNMLQTRFRDRPGSERVSAGQFRVLNARKESSILDGRTWAEKVEPGMALVMSIEITKLRRPIQRGRCLRSACTGSLRISNVGRLECSICNLYCYEEDASRPEPKVTPIYGPQDFRKEVEKTRAYLKTLEMRKPGAQQQSGSISVTHSRSTNARARNKRLTALRGAEIKMELARSKAESQYRDQRRGNENWAIESRKLDELRQEVAAMEEQERREAIEREERELRVFLRVHIRTSTYQSPLRDTASDYESSNLPVQRLKWSIKKPHSLVDVVVEEDSTWAAACMINAIRNGAEIDSIDPCFGTALQASAVIGCMTKASLLLEHGADPLKPSPSHKSAIHAAAICNHDDVLSLLLKSCHGAIDHNSRGTEEIARLLLFRDTCDSALQAATLRGCNKSVLSLLNFTDHVDVGIALSSNNDSTMTIIMGEAIRKGEESLEKCVRMIRDETNSEYIDGSGVKTGVTYERLDLDW